MSDRFICVFDCRKPLAKLATVYETVMSRSGFGLDSLADRRVYRQSTAGDLIPVVLAVLALRYLSTIAINSFHLLQRGVPPKRRRRRVIHPTKRSYAS